MAADLLAGPDARIRGVEGGLACSHVRRDTTHRRCEIIVRMTAAFIVEDDFHAERMCEFSNRGAAIAFLERLKADAVSS